MSRNPNSFNPITQEEIRERRPALDLLARQNTLTDQLIQAEDLQSEIRKNVASGGLVLNEIVLTHSNNALMSVADNLRRTFLETTETGEDSEENLRLKRALRELQRLNIARADEYTPEESGMVFNLAEEFSVGEEMKKIQEEEQTFADEEIISVGLMSTRARKIAAKEQKARMVSKRKELEDRKARLQTERLTKKSGRAQAAEHVVRALNANSLDPLEKKMEEILSYLNALWDCVQIITASRNLEANENPQALAHIPTPLQKVGAKRLLNEIKKYAKESNTANYEKMRAEYQVFKDTLDSRKKVEEVKEKSEDVLTELMAEMAKAKAQVDGITAILETSPIRSEDQAELEVLKKQFAEAGGEVSSEFAKVKGKLEQVIAVMEDGKPEQIEGLALELAEGSVQEIYLTDFNAKMAVLKETINKLRLFLDPSRRRRALTATTETRQLPAHERGVINAPAVTAEIFADFTYNETEATRLGLKRLDLAGNTEADGLIEQANFGTPEGKRRFVELWHAKCPDIKLPCVPDKDDFWYLENLKEGRIVTNLSGDAKRVKTNFGQPEVILVDDWQECDWGTREAATAHRSVLLEELLGRASTVNVKRKEIDQALWGINADLRQQSQKQIDIITKLGLNPDEFELRLIRQDESARGATAKGWGQHNLWTNYQDYFLEGVGDRYGLFGGNLANGGVSNVYYFWRDNANGSLAVRLVLSRKQ